MSSGPGGDARWWGGGSGFRYDRLVTAWIVREADGYFGVAGVTDAEGGATQRLMKRSTDVLLRPGEDRRSVAVGVPASSSCPSIGKCRARSARPRTRSRVWTPAPASSAPYGAAYIVLLIRVIDTGLVALVGWHLGLSA
jgi:hypothetical protein